MARTTSRRASGDLQRNSAQNIRAVSLSEQLNKIGRHPYVILVTVIVGAIIGALVSISSPAAYQATATVLATPLSPDPNANASSQLTLKIDTEAGVASSREVAETAAQEIDANDRTLASTISQSIDVAPHSGTEVIDITATASTPEDAALYANSVAESYLKVREDDAKQRVDTAAAEAQRQLDSLPANTPSETRSAIAEKLTNIRLTNTDPGRVITVAQQPQHSQNLGLWKSAVIGAAAGVFVGVLLAWIIDSRSRKLSYIDRAQDAAGSDVYEIRQNSAEEDTRRLLMGLGAPAGKFSADLPGVVVFSPTSNLGDRFTDILKSSLTQKNVIFTNSISAVLEADVPLSASANQPVVITAPPSTEYSQVLTVAESLGTALMVVDSTTTGEDLSEFSRIAEKLSDVSVAYVYLNS